MSATTKKWPATVRDCPRAAELHTSCPDAYLAWHDWANDKAKTHYQERCPECALWAIWVPKAKAGTPERAAQKRRVAAQRRNDPRAEAHREAPESEGHDE
jgi:hypothetical protein